MEGNVSFDYTSYKTNTERKIMMKIEIREWQDEDIVSLQKNINNWNVLKYMGILIFPYTMDDAKSWIEFCKQADTRKDLNYAIVVDGLAVGAVGVAKKSAIYQKTGELGYWLGEDYWRKGIVSTAVKMMLEIAFDKLDIVRIEAPIFDENIGSQKVVESCGLTRESIMKKTFYRDEIYYDGYLYVLIKD